MLVVSGVELRDDVRLIKKYAYFCLSKFVSNSVLKKSLVTIKLISVQDLKDKKEQKELKDWAAWMTYDGLVEEKKKFTITLDCARINTNGKKQITRYKNTLKDLGHELVHVKQYLLNEMFDYTDGQTVRYMGDLYKSDESEWSYWDAPYEIEAYGRAEGLFSMFKKMLKKEEKKA